MTATERRKGATFERTIAAYLRGLGVPSERTSRGVHQHGGDLTNTLGLHIEAKCAKTLDLAGWMRQAYTDAATSGRTPVLVVKRRTVADPARQWAVLELGSLLALLGVTDTEEGAAGP